MSVPAGGRSPLTDFLQVSNLTERELQRQLRAAQREVKRLLRSGNPQRRAQYELAVAEAKQVMDTLWGEAVLDTVSTGKRRSVDRAADNAMEVLTDYSSGRFPSDMRNGFRAQARAGVENLISRSTNQISLSERVYGRANLTNGRIDRIVNTGLIGGQSAKEIADRVGSFILPDVPGGVRYAAMRLGRTELNNAFHSSSIKTYTSMPFVEAMAWNLSRSHPEPDECDRLLADSPYPGDKVPGKPHPQCLCFVTPEMNDEDDFVKAFAEGKYDAWADEMLAAGSEPYAATQASKAASLRQRRVMQDNGKMKAVVDMSPAERRFFLTAEELRLIDSE